MFELLRQLFRRRNPTHAWMEDPSRSLTFDLDECSLNHVRLGEPLERLSFLGPDESHADFQDGVLVYRTRGLAVRYSPKTRTLLEYRVVCNDPIDMGFRSFFGTTVAKGQRLELPNLSPESLARVYGEPFWRDCDDEEVILFYEFIGLEWQVEFSLSGNLRCITVTSEPIMASEDQRLAYGVSAVWPPVSRTST
jgi:hypothetical protein